MSNSLYWKTGTSKSKPRRFTLLVARHAWQAESLLNLAFQAGGWGCAVPLIEVNVEPNLQAVKCLQGAGSAQVIVATSANALRALAKVEEKEGLTFPKTCYVIGEASARAAINLGFSPVYYKHIKTGKDLAYHLSRVLPPGLEILFPQGDLSDAAVPDILRQAGHHVTACTCYTTHDAILDETLWQELTQFPPTFLVLYSPSAVRSFHRIRKKLMQMPAFRVICIGPTTAEACQVLAIPVAGVASAPTDEGVLSVITSFLKA